MQSIKSEHIYSKNVTIHNLLKSLMYSRSINDYPDTIFKKNNITTNGKGTGSITYFSTHLVPPVLKVFLNQKDIEMKEVITFDLSIAGKGTIESVAVSDESKLPYMKIRTQYFENNNTVFSKTVVNCKLCETGMPMFVLQQVEKLTKDKSTLVRSIEEKNISAIEQKKTTKN